MESSKNTMLKYSFCDMHKLYFREKTNTEAFAEQERIKIQQMDSGNFNPLGYRCYGAWHRKRIG